MTRKVNLLRCTSFPGTSTSHLSPAGDAEILTSIKICLKNENPRSLCGLFPFRHQVMHLFSLDLIRNSFAQTDEHTAIKTSVHHIKETNFKRRTWKGTISFRCLGVWTQDVRGGGRGQRDLKTDNLIVGSGVGPNSNSHPRLTSVFAILCCHFHYLGSA